jgi:hypothetical protein
LFSPLLQVCNKRPPVFALTGTEHVVTNASPIFGSFLPQAVFALCGDCFVEVADGFKFPAGSAFFAFDLLCHVDE